MPLVSNIKRLIQRERRNISLKRRGTISRRCHCYPKMKSVDWVTIRILFFQTRYIQLTHISPTEHLKLLFDVLWNLGEPIVECLKCVKTIDEARPLVSKLWDYSGFKKSIDAFLVPVHSFQTAAYVGMVYGELDVDSPAVCCSAFAMEAKDVVLTIHYSSL